MSFLLDTNICSAYLKGDGHIFNRFIQHSGGLHTSAICVGELYSWVHLARTSPKYAQGLADLLRDILILPVDHEVARRFGELRAQLLDKGRPTPEIDLLIAATALQHNLILVTHNTHDFLHVPGLRVVDWLMT